MHSTLLLASLAASVASATFALSYVECPTDASVRLTGSPQGGNQTLSQGEQAYTQARKAQADEALRTWLSRGNLSSTVYGGDFASVNASNLPSIALSLSGGGNRAALFGAGALAAFDARNETSVSKGTGGLLQSSTYITGLSGGSWLLSSFLLNDYPEPYEMVLGDGTNSSRYGWNLDLDLFAPGDSNQSSAYQRGLFQDLATKKSAGQWNVTINDVWARALSYHFLPGTTKDNFFTNDSDHGASIRLSSATNLSSWQNNSMPYPVIVGAVLSVNEQAAPLEGAYVPIQNVVYEMSPLEFGSYDPELSAFIPMSSLGTEFSSGSVVGQCVDNFDNAGWTFGWSSLVFHAYNITQNIAWTSPISPINVLWTTINSTFYDVQPDQQLDIAAVPNPFQGVMQGRFEDATERQLRGVDGGFNGEVDPVGPLLVKARMIDVIVVADATADSELQMPTGASMVATELRAINLGNGTLSIPPLPNSNYTYVEKGLNQRPTFFGCNGTAAQLNSAPADSPYPLIIYLPNYDPTGVTNTSTGQLVYTNEEAQQFLDTAVDISTRGMNNNATEWATCLACAVVERTRGREGVDRTATCDTCFASYCWDGSESALSPPEGNGTTGAGGNSTGAAGGSGSNGTANGGSGSAGNGGQAPVSAATALVGGKAAGIVGALIAAGVALVAF